MAWRQWQGELVVFNPLSGSSHVLDVASSELLLTLMAGPAGRDRLAGHLAEWLEVEPDGETRAATDKILEDLNRLGLAEPAGP